jgi:hypothetical protein
MYLCMHGHVCAFINYSSFVAITTNHNRYTATVQSACSVSCCRAVAGGREQCFIGTKAGRLNEFFYNETL